MLKYRSTSNRLILISVIVITPILLVHLLAAISKQARLQAYSTAYTPQQHIPIIRTLIGPPLALPVAISTFQTINPQVIETELQERGMSLSLNKIGFHVGVGGNKTGIGDWWTALNDNHVPVVLKSVGNGGGSVVERLAGQAGCVGSVLRWWHCLIPVGGSRQTTPAH